MKVLLLGRYTRKGASTRLRFLQYMPYLQSNGVTVHQAPLLDDEYLDALYTGRGRSPTRLGMAYLKRLFRLLSARKYDLLWIEKEVFPRLPATAERMMARSGVRYVVDYDDAIFHDYDLNASRFMRWAMSNKIDYVMNRSYLVVAGSKYLAARAEAAGARRTELLPTVVDLNRYRIDPRNDDEKDFKIGWIGTPVTARYLSTIAASLSAVCSAKAAKLVLVGAGRNPLPKLYAEVRPWTEHGEVAEISRFDVGVMPLPDEPWAWGKCGYKLIQYMAAGKPVVASPVGANLDIVEHGRNGFLASSEAEWSAALQALAASSELREQMGRAGRKIVEERYTLSVAAPRLRQWLLQAGGRAA